MYRATTIWKANIAEIIRNCTMLAPETLRERRIRSGISGVAAVAWRTKNPASSASAMHARPSVRTEPQPWSAVPTTV